MKHAGPGERPPGGLPHPTVLAFWLAFFEEMSRGNSPLRCLDVASGERVLAGLYSTFDDYSLQVTCVDTSADAIRNLKSRFPQVTGIVADAGAIPLDSNGFDLVTSEFGIEGAGIEATRELARLLAPGGRLGLLACCRHSGIYRAYEASLDAIRRTQAASFIPLSMQLFETGFAAIRGADREAYERAAQALDPALRVLDGILEEHGEQVAGYAIRRLYDDVARMHGRMQFHDPEEVTAWLGRMQGELAASETRLSSLCESALDRPAFERLIDRLAAEGMSILRADELIDAADGSPLAWAVVAERPRDVAPPDRSAPASGDTAANHSDAAAAAPQERTRHVDWAKRQLGHAVDIVLGRGILPGAVAEAKPAWALPEQLVIGRLRRPGADTFFWVIGGVFPSDCIPSDVASTPREAARHFVLRWQLEAARAREAGGTRHLPMVDAGELERSAEQLFGIVRDDALWPPAPDPG